MVVCPHCQRESVDPQFCDHCNCQLPVAGGKLPGRVALPDGRVIDCSRFHGWPADCSRPLRVFDGGPPLRVYALNRGWWADLGQHVVRRAALSLNAFAPIEVVGVGEGALVIAHAIPNGVNPLPRDCEDEAERVERTLAACGTIAAVLSHLHGAGLVWLNFDPDQLEVDAQRVQITNLDLQVFPTGAAPDVVRISPAYSPPEVCAFCDEKIGPATDTYHLGMYAYYRLAGLLPAGFPGVGLEAFDFEIPPLRIYRPTLPPGIVGVFRRALARDPADRYPTAAEFVAELTAVVERMRKRLAPPASFRWESGSATAIGRSHVASGLPNQDAHTMLSLDRTRSLYLVADGVTTCSVGSGDLASQLAIDVLATELPDLLRPDLSEAQIEQALAEGCRRASEVILRRAVQIGVPAGADPAELMSSTMLICYAHGDVLSLACLGDSRAYLVGLREAEQLTVDGDVRCVHLAHGIPPEQVRDLGTDALALFSCLGVGEHGPDGSLIRCEIRTRPQVTHWPMRPGHLIVLATDGLVEEGAYLDPADLTRLCRLYGPVGQRIGAVQSGGTTESMSTLAERLVAAACDRHRDPSMWEPGGSGDDVTCVVLWAQLTEPEKPRSPNRPR